MNKYTKEEKAKVIEWLDNIDVTKLEKMMEKMAGAPREEYGKRQPGEKCSYEKWNEEKLNGN